MKKNYDVIIAGGGLAGLTAAIHLSQHFKVLVIDPDTYPRHKMCGEYLSMEVDSYLKSLGIHINDLSQVTINNFRFTRGSQSIKTATLPLGGIGVSRYSLDLELYNKAKEKTDFLLDRVLDIILNHNHYEVITTDQKLTARQVIIATGKRSLLDKKLARPFIQKKSPWLAVKMHYKFKMSNDIVELHAFKGGYAGLSKIENGNVNLCYLVNYESFKEYKDINAFNKEVLTQNIALKEFFKVAVPIWEKPITISQISFEQKQPVEGKLLMIGDTAGLIHPLCGNGMAMAIHSAQIASKYVTQYLQDEITRDQMLIKYSKSWRKTFSNRLLYGRWLQKVLLHKKLTTLSYWFLERLPFLLPIIIKKTHGKEIQP
ncbi:probable alkylhalidase homolog [Nonlabens ulvanivorans]|uniref:Probable alkylhalidase homolog n=1 Tax=Nonlabens ulvanivorans TaxID=906888 RepID=A0A081DF77_NONUL|nr:NAD(P)/FAD-dependent oxidoreductase [Nonlabens ulvanivorans]GAK77573.1 probable alkylhalidase homolog [Nonlabens ulvanivorans]